MAKNEDMVVIADTQVQPNVLLDHLHALARYIWQYKPKYVIHIGDNWDFPSLSFYASLFESEGRRLADDLKAGEAALRIITDYIDLMNSKSKAKKKYKPEYHFLFGNHEQRLTRMAEKTPHLYGLVDLEGMVRRAGWQPHKFLVPLWINDVCINHYMPNPLTSKPIGGGIENKLNKHAHSFIQGHVQIFQFGRRQNLAGKPHFGICAGAFYMHDEAYRGACNTEIRGFTHLLGFNNRYGYQDYDTNYISLERLLDMY